MSHLPWISLLTFTPLLGAIVVAGTGGRCPGWARGLTVVFNGLALVMACGLWANYQPAGGYQFGEQHGWVRSLNVEYFVALDGLGLVMVLLTALVVPFAVLSSREIKERPALYYALMLFLQSGLFGVFTALNFYHWFLFWELSLIPAFFLIKLWGGPRRSFAATQFFIYTMVGSVALLLAFQAIYWATKSFDFIKLSEMGRSGELAAQMSANLGWKDLTTARLVLVIGFGVFLGLAFKVPVMPFHTWLPEAYTEAPTPVTMVLTGVMSKMGLYGFLRIFVPIFAESLRVVWLPLVGLAVLTIVASAWAALVQKDLKRMLAYSSINHLGYCLLGIFAALKATGPEPQWALEKAAAYQGVIVQMFSHGLVASTLFCFVGWLEQRSGGRRGLQDFGGLRQVVPVYCGLMGIAVFASLGLPGLCGFVGEFLIFKGVFPLAPGAAILAVLGLLLTALFLLAFLQRVFHGPLNDRWAGLRDLNARECWLVAPAIALMFLLGLYPQAIIGLINPTVMDLVARLAG
jgi:NADH-quinone oxidoreductase subunit M